MENDERLLDPGSTDPVVLYDFASVLGIVFDSFLLDRKSELWRMFRLVFNSAWGHLPEIVTIDLRDPSLPSDLSR